MRYTVYFKNILILIIQLLDSFFYPFKLFLGETLFKNRFIGNPEDYKVVDYREKVELHKNKAFGPSVNR